MKLEEIYYTYKFPAFMEFWDSLKFHQKKWIEEEFEATIEQMDDNTFKSGYHSGVDDGHSEGLYSGRIEGIKETLAILKSKLSVNDIVKMSMESKLKDIDLAIKEG